MHTYNQDLVSVVVAHCISYAPKICSHCSRCCCCLLLYDRQHMGIRLIPARGPARPVPQIMTFVFPAFTLNPFFSMSSFHIKSLLTHSFHIKSLLICLQIPNGFVCQQDLDKIWCDDSTACDAANNYFATEADTMTDILYEYDLVGGGGVRFGST